MSLVTKLALGGAASALLVLAALTTRAYQSDLTAARQRVANGGSVTQTACGPIQYAEIGQGKPVLLIHGAGGGYDQSMLLAQITVGEGYRVIAPSRFGFLGTPGRDPATPDGSQAAQADAHACLLDALGIQRVAVIGYSAGGPSALQFAQRYPDRTTALVLLSAVSPAPQQPASQTPAWLFQAMFATDFGYWALIRVAPAQMLSRLGVSPEVQASLAPDEWQWMRDFLFSMLPMTARRDGIYYDLHMPLAIGFALDEIHAPTLVIHTQDDTLVQFDPNAEYNASHIAGARLVSLPRGGHLLSGWHNRVRAEVEAFLSEQAAGAVARW